MATTRDEYDAWSVACPLCKARPQAQCVYLADTPDVNRYGEKLARAAVKAGDTTRRPHNERYRLAWQLEQRQKLADYYAIISKDPYQDARRAYADELVREHQELKTWLRQNGRILWT